MEFGVQSTTIRKRCEGGGRSGDVRRSHLRERSPATPAVKATAKPAAAAAVKRTQPLVSQPAPVKEGSRAKLG